MGLRFNVVASVLAVSASVFAPAPAAVAQQDSAAYSDVSPTAYYAVPVAALAEQGIFDGTECAEGFCPGDPIDRKTMAVWVVRVLDGEDPAPPSQARFDDVDIDSFYAPFIERMFDLGVTQGCGDGSGFCPDRNVTRAEMAVFLSRAYNLPDGPNPDFADVPRDAWYGAEVVNLAASGITRGCGDGTRFCPGRDTTRAQMATFLYRAGELVPDACQRLRDPTWYWKDRDFRIDWTGTVRVAVLFVDFPDLPADRTTYQQAENLPLAKQYLEANSYGKLDLEFVPLHRWLRAAHSLDHYLQPLLDRNRIGIGRMIDSEAVRLADSDFDFSGIDILLISTPVDYDRMSADGTAGGLGVETNEGFIGPTSRTSSSWRTAAHELGHNFGLPDLYQYSNTNIVDPDVADAGFYGSAFEDILHSEGWTETSRGGLMGGIDILVPPLINLTVGGMSAWSRWVVGWLDETQVRCITQPEATVALTPVSDPGDGTAMAAIPLSETELLIMESHRLIDKDESPGIWENGIRIEGASLPDETSSSDHTERSELPSSEGVMLYTANYRIRAGHKPLRGLNPTVDSSGSSISSFESESPFLTVGDSITAKGYRIALLSDDGSAHTVSVTRTSEPRPLVAAMFSHAEPVVYRAFTVDISFSEPVSDFEQDDITVLNGTVTNLYMASSRTYGATIVPSANGEVRVTVSEGAAHDTRGQPSTAAGTLIRESRIEGGPTVSISSSAPLVVHGSFDVVLTFSDPPEGGFGQEQLAVINGTVTSFVGSGRTYTATIVPGTADQRFPVVMLDVAGFRDALGRASQPSDTFCRMTTDRPLSFVGDCRWTEDIEGGPEDIEGGPTVSISSSAPLVVNGSFDVTIAFSSSVKGFEEDKITVSNGTVTSLSGSGKTYTASIMPGGDGGLVFVFIRDRATRDVVGRPNSRSEPFCRTTSTQWLPAVEACLRGWNEGVE